MTYQDALHKLLSLTDYERMLGLATPRPKFGLDRMLALLSRVGNPHTCAPVVHIAGTKGKGSVAAMYTSILTAEGYGVGLFTSPHLHTFRERIRIGSKPVTENEFNFLIDTLWPHIEAIESEGIHGSVTTFELLTAMAFLHFRNQAVDVQVLEVGLGGRLDTTNVAHGGVCVITPISLDHTNVLGNTLGEIAQEKTGIIKEGSHVISAPQEPAPALTIKNMCQIKGASLHVAGQDTTWNQGDRTLAGQSFVVRTPMRQYNLWIPLLGTHQIENASVAIAAVECSHKLNLHVSSESVSHGLSEIRWPGRLDILGINPLVVTDGAHNIHSMKRLAEAIVDFFCYKHLLVVMGCSSDKDLNGMMEWIAPLADYTFTGSSRHPRASAPDRIADAFRLRGVPSVAFSDIASALQEACSQAGPQDLVLATGSLFVAAEAIQAMSGIPGEIYPSFDPYTYASTSLTNTRPSLDL